MDALQMWYGSQSSGLYLIFVKLLLAYLAVGLQKLKAKVLEK